MPGYAIPGNRHFVTDKELKPTKLSPEAVARRDYIRSHNFSVYTDPKTGEPVLKVTEK